MDYLKKIIFLLLSTFLCIISYAQDATPGSANTLFKAGNYSEALEIYKQLIEKDSENIDYPYKAGICILQLNQNKSEAIKFLKIASERKSDVDADFYLGRAYHLNLKLDKALDSFNNYKKSNSGKKQDEVDRQIEMVRNAMRMVQSPVDVSFENAGDLINTKYPDYYPFVTPNESFLVFTSRREGIKEFDGNYPSNVYYSKVRNGEFVKSKKANAIINSSHDEQAVGLSYNADKLYVYADNIKTFGDIHEVEMRKLKFVKKNKMGENVNSKGFESSATISADGNTLFFASNRNGSYGAKDIYMTKKLPNGNWALPQNLGPTINTIYDEDFPNLFYDGSTLYFSSKGHNSIGGYDYFKSNWDINTNTWSKPENIGYPINTPEDDLCISFTEDRNHAYISQWRKDSKGFQDIYKVTFNELDKRQTILKSKIVEEGSSKAILDALVIVTDNRTQEEIGRYTPNSSNGSFIIALVPGSYNILINITDLPPKSEDIVIKGKSDFIPFIKKTFTLAP